MQNIDSTEQTAQSVPYLYVWNDNFRRVTESNFATGKTYLTGQAYHPLSLNLLYSTYFLALIQLTLFWLNHH